MDTLQTERKQGENITIKQAAAMMGKCQQFIRVGLQRGLLPFGTAVKVSKRWNYYISPKLFKEYVGTTIGGSVNE